MTRIHRIRAIWGRAVAVLGCVCLVSLGACEKRVEYSQATADDALQSAIRMVKDRRAARLADLVYAESPDMRAMLGRMGDLLGSVQGLAAAIQERFPKDVEALKQRAIAEAANASNAGAAPGGLFAMFQRPRRSGGAGGGSEGGGEAEGGGGERGDDGQRLFEATAQSVLADPYGWIERNAARLSTVGVSDDLAAVLLDGKPILPPLGVTMRLEAGKWYVVLPLNLPPVNQYVPRRQREWQMLGLLMKAWQNAIIEMTSEVNSGKVASIEELASGAGEKLFIPTGIWFVGYAREMDVRRRTEDTLRQFGERRKKWLAGEFPIERSAGARSGSTPRALPKGVSEAIDAIAPEKIESLVRTNQRPRPADMSDPDFQSLVEGWLKDEGFGEVSLLAPPPDADAAAALEQWRKARAVVPRPRK
ncbi:MAG: hypothetical protein JNM07_06895 [Phycisphaerae bacterium]|nr:hypothetical protein [Phycisphaerae bacterium]